MNPDHLTNYNKAKLLNRWKSIKGHAIKNMEYGSGGSYVTSAGGCQRVTLAKDESALAIIDEILNHVLKS